MRTKWFTILAVLLATPCLSKVSVREYAMPALEAVPYSPVVCGDWALVQLNSKYGDGHTIGVVAFDLKAKKPYTVFQGNAAAGIAITGSLAMWCQQRGGQADLVGYDLTSGQNWMPEITKCAMDPDAYGDYVVYECNRFIYLYSISTGVRIRISDQRRVHRYPNICGDLVVWVEYEDTKSNKNRVRGFRISTRQECVFSEEFDDTNSRPETDGAYVVWHSNKIGGVAYDAKTSKVRIIKYALFPTVGDGFIVYEKPVKPRGEDSHATPRIVCGMDLRSNGEEFQVSKNQDIRQVSMTGNRVVWNEGNILHYADLTRTSELKPQ